MGNSTITPEDKGALLLKSLPQDVVESVLAQLSPQHRDKLRQRMQSVGQSGERIGLDELFAEMASASSPGRPTAQPRSVQPAPRNEDSAFPDDAEVARDPVAALATVDVERLARSLGDEKPATVSLLLNHMELARAGEVYRKLPTDLRREVSVHLSAGADCALEVVRRIAGAVLQKCKLLKDQPPAPDPNARFIKIAEMLRSLEKEERTDIIATMEQRDAAAAASVKALLYHFDDVLRMDGRSVQRLLSEIDTKALAIALKTASPEIKDKFLTNMSKRAQEALTEEMEFSGNIPNIQIQQAQKTITDVLQRLDLANEITLN